MNEVSNDSWGRETSERGGTRRNEGWARGGNYNEATIQREVTRLGSQWKLGMDGHRDKLMWCWGGEGDDGWRVRWSRTEKRWGNRSVETPLKKFLDGKSISWVSKRCQKVFFNYCCSKIQFPDLELTVTLRKVPPEVLGLLAKRWLNQSTVKNWWKKTLFWLINQQ